MDPKHKYLKLGALRVNQPLRKQIPVVNNSPAPITFRLGFTPSNTTLNDTDIFRMTPNANQNITLAARGGTTKIEIFFHPRSRIPQFTEEVLMESAGLSQTLFVINGCCQGVEITLDTDYIPFGSVVQRSSNMRKLIMTNTGDIGSR